MNVQQRRTPVDIGLLACPQCRASDFAEQETKLVCNACGASYRRESGKVFFTEDYFDVDSWEKKSSDFDLFRRPSPLASLAVDRIGGPRIRDLKSYLGVDGVVLNLGSGKDNYDGHTNIDLGRYANVDIVSGLEGIPYRDGSVDLLVSNSVLEHICDYQRVIGEIFRVLKPGGFVYLCVPSLCMRHHARDYHRWTIPGLEALLGRFKIVESGSCRNVAYVLVTVVEALIVSKTSPGFVREMLRRLWLFASLPLFWLRDERTPEFEAMSQTIYIIARKPAGGALEASASD